MCQVIRDVLHFWVHIYQTGWEVFVEAFLFLRVAEGLLNYFLFCLSFTSLFSFSLPISLWPYTLSPIYPVWETKGPSPMDRSQDSRAPVWTGIVARTCSVTCIRPKRIFSFPWTFAGHCRLIFYSIFTSKVSFKRSLFYLNIDVLF